MVLALREQHCQPCTAGTPALAGERIEVLRKQLDPRWQLRDGKELVAQFEFRNYWETSAFVNAVAWIAHREDHHPDISFGYKTCTIAYSTHSVGGLSENDFICAARVDQLLK